MRKINAVLISILLFISTFTILPTELIKSQNTPLTFDLIDGALTEPRAKTSPTTARGVDWSLSTLDGIKFIWRSEPVNIWSESDNSYQPYIFIDNYVSDGYYQVQFPTIGIRIYEYYAVFYSPDMNEVRLYDERFEVLRWRPQGQGSWNDIGAQSGTPIFSLVYNDESIHIKKTFTHWAGNLSITYSFNEGNILKHTIKSCSTLPSETIFNVKHSWAGIVGDRVKTDRGLTIINNANIINASSFRFLKVDGSLSIFEDQFKMYYGYNESSGQHYILQNQNVKPVEIDVHAQGMKADFIYGNWSLAQGECLTIDPDSATLSPPTDDAYIDSFNPAVNFGGAVLLATGGTAAQQWRSLVTFDLTSIPSNATITTADFMMFYYAWAGADAVGVQQDAHFNLAAWTEGVVTWNNQPAHSVTKSFTTVPAAFGWMTWSVISDVQRMIEGTISNFGWKVKELVDNPPPAYKSPRWRSKEFGANVPKLELVFFILVKGEIPSVKAGISNDTTTSTTYEDVDGLAINITLFNEADILIMASIQGQANVSAVASYRLVLNDTNYQGLSRQVSTLAGNLVLVDLAKDQPAGRYELKLQHNISAGRLSTINTTIYAVNLHNGNGRIPSNDSFTASDTIAGTAPADIAGLSLEITTQRNSHIWAALTWSGQQSVNNRQGNFTINIDGTNMETRFRSFPTSNQWGSLSLITRSNDKIPNGTHTVRGIWEGDVAGTLTGMNFSLVVFAGEANGTVAEFEIQKIVNEDDTTTSTTFENIDDLNLAVTTPNTTHVMGFLTFDSEVSVINTDIFHTININETDQELMKRGHPAPAIGLGSIGQVARTNDTLAAGEINVTARWHTDGGNTATGMNIILVTIVLFTEDTGVFQLTIIFHTGISEVLVGGDSRANLSVTLVTEGDTVNITSLITASFTFYRYEFLEFFNHTHNNPRLQVINQDLTVESFALSIGGGGGVVINDAGVGFIIIAVVAGFFSLLFLVTRRKN